MSDKAANLRESLEVLEKFLPTTIQKQKPTKPSAIFGILDISFFPNQGFKSNCPLNFKGGNLC